MEHGKFPKKRKADFSIRTTHSKANPDPTKKKLAGLRRKYLDEDNSLIKYGAIAGALFLVYKNWQTIGPYLGFAPSFTDQASLQAYCQANPTKSATFNGSTFSCAAWLQAMGVQPTPPPAATSQQQPNGMGGMPGMKEDKWVPPQPWSPTVN